MALQLQLENGSLVGGGGAAFKGANVHAKPIDYGSFGHYRTVFVLTMVADMIANARLFQIRNTGAQLIIPTRFHVSVLPVGSVANPYAFELALYKYTSFSAVDTLNTSTPEAATMKTSGMTAAPGNALLRHASAGVNSGMSGGTLTKDERIGSLLSWMASVSATSSPITKDLLELKAGEHPPVFAQNEGMGLENVVVGSATANAIKVMVELSWVETTAVIGGF
jgi:hypothetical protein